MSFNLQTLLTSFHQIVMEVFGPLLNWFDSVSALQPLQPYRHCLPYVVIGLGLFLLLLLAHVLRRKGRGPRGGKTTRSPSTSASSSTSSSTSSGMPVQGRAIDIMPDFSDPAPQTSTPTQAGGEEFSVPTAGGSGAAAPDFAATSPVILSAPASGATFGPSANPVPPPAAAFAGAFIPSTAPIPAAAPTPPAASTAARTPAPTQTPAPAPAAPRHEAPKPPRTAASLITPPESEFQRIYIEMYIYLELTTNFSALRANVNGMLSQGASTEPLMPEGSANSEEHILACTALAALEDLQTKESRLESGELSPHGEELCKIYNYILNRLKGGGKLSEDSARDLLKATLEKVPGTTGAS